MDLLASLQVMVRRWYIVLAGLLLTFGAAFGLSSQMAPSFQTVGSVVLLPPTSDPVSKTTVNPLTQFSSYLETTADLLVGVVTSDASREALTAKGASSKWDLESAGPILTVTASSDSEASAKATAKMVLDAVDAELARRQSDYAAQPRNRIHADSVVAPNVATHKFGSLLRVVGAIGVLGVAGTMTLTFGIDGLMRRRVLAAKSQPADRPARGEPPMPWPITEARPDPRPEPRLEPRLVPRSPRPANGAPAQGSQGYPGPTDRPVRPESDRSRPRPPQRQAAARFEQPGQQVRPVPNGVPNGARPAVPRRPQLRSAQPNPDQAQRGWSGQPSAGPSSAVETPAEPTALPNGGRRPRQAWDPQTKRPTA